MKRRAPLVLGLALASCQDPPPTPPSFDATGFEPQVARALTKGRDAVLAEPDSAEAWGRLAMLFDVHWLVEEAATAYLAAERLAPDDFRWPYFYALCVPDRTLDIAIAALERARALSPDYVPLNVRLGQYYIQSDDADAARRAFEHVLRIDDSNAHALFGLARLAVDDDELPRSRELLELAVAANPNHREAQTLLATSLGRLGDIDAARAAQARAEKLRGRTSIPDPARAEIHQFGVSRKHLMNQGRNALKAKRPEIAAAPVPSSARTRSEQPGHPVCIRAVPVHPRPRRRRLHGAAQDHEGRPRRPAGAPRLPRSRAATRVLSLDDS